VIATAALIFLAASFVSRWGSPKTNIWALFAAISVSLGIISSHILFSGALFLIFLFLFFTIYFKQRSILCFCAIITLATALKLKLLPGYEPIFLAPRLSIGLQTDLIGLVPLAYFIPLAQSKKDWSAVLRGALVGVLGIALLALVAQMAGAVEWQFKRIPALEMRLMTNFFLTAIPEEAFYRGFIQREIVRYFNNQVWGKIAALLITSILFTVAHLFWSPSGALLGFVFLASLLYGGIYMISGKIESAIATHFLLNAIHMLFFSYHAL